MALTDGLVAYWKLDESSGNAADSSGAGLTLTNNGTIPYVAGKINNGADLERDSSQYFSRTNGGTFDTTEGTICLWVNAETLNNSSAMVETTTLSGSEGYFFDARADGSVRLAFGAGSNIAQSATGVLTTGTYYFVTATWNTLRKEVFVNASSVATNETDETLAAGTTLHVGRLPTIDADHWDGILDEIGIWNRVLTSTEISQLYNGGTGLSYPFTLNAARTAPTLLTLGVG